MVRNILEYLEATAVKLPQKTLISDTENRVSFSEMVSTAQAIGSYLIGCGVRRKSPVVVFIDRTVKNVVSYMGIVYAGCFYVPIDAAFPEERIKTILSTVEPAYIIADEASGKTQYIHNGNVSLCGNYRNTSEPHPVRFVDKSS